MDVESEVQFNYDEIGIVITSSLHIDFILKFVSGEEFSLTLVGRLNVAASSLNTDAALIRLLQVLLPPFIFRSAAPESVCRMQVRLSRLCGTRWLSKKRIMINPLITFRILHDQLPAQILPTFRAATEVLH